MFDGLEEEFEEGFSLEEIEDESNQHVEEQLLEEELEETEELNLEEEEEEEEEELDEELEEEELEEGDEPSFSPFIATLEESGLVFLDPEKEYDDSIEGFQEIIQDTVDVRLQETIESLSPKAQRLLEIEMAGGNIEEAFEVFNTFDYSQVDVSDPDVARELVREYYQEINPRWTDERINKQLDALDADGELETEASDAQTFFIERDEQTQAEYTQRVQAERLEAEQAYYAEVEEYENIIDSNDALFGLPFASSMEKEAFKRYCFERGEDGKTQAERDDDDKLTRITKEFYKFKKFNYTDVEKRAKTKAVVDIKKQLSHFGRKAPGTTRAQSPRKSSGFSLGELDF